MDDNKVLSKGVNLEGQRRQTDQHGTSGGEGLVGKGRGRGGRRGSGYPSTGGRGEGSALIHPLVLPNKKIPGGKQSWTRCHTSLCRGPKEGTEEIGTGVEGRKTHRGLAAGPPRTWFTNPTPTTRSVGAIPPPQRNPPPPNPFRGLGLGSAFGQGGRGART